MKRMIISVTKRAFMLSLIASFASARPTACQTLFGTGELHRASLAALGVESFTPRKMSDPLPGGIEIEGFLPKKNLEKAYNLITEELRQTPGVNHLHRWSGVGPLAENALIIHFERNGWRDRYTFKVDNSLSSKGAWIGRELVTPVLRTAQDLELALRILSRLKHEVNFKPHRSAGVHIHTDFSQGTLQELMYVAQVYRRFEADLYRTFSVLPSRVREFAQPLHNRLIKAIGAEFLLNPQAKEPMAHHFGNLGREHGLNARALFDHKTLEMRLFNSTTDPKEIEVIFTFVQEFFRAIRTQDPRLIQFLVESQSRTDLRIDELAEILGLSLAREKEVLRTIFLRAEADVKAQQRGRAFMFISSIVLSWAAVFGVIAVLF